MLAAFASLSLLLTPSRGDHWPNVNWHDDTASAGPRDHLLESAFSKSWIHFDTRPGKDGTESGAGTVNKICVYGSDLKFGRDVETCSWGLDEAGEFLDFFHLDEKDMELNPDLPVYVMIFGGNAIWVDTFKVKWSSQLFKTWGSHDTKGWCLSSQYSDKDGWGGTVEDGKCYDIIELSPDGNWDGIDLSHVDSTTRSALKRGPSFTKIRLRGTAYVTRRLLADEDEQRLDAPRLLEAEA